MVYDGKLAPMTWADAGYLLPELILIGMMALLIVLDLVLPKRIDRSIIGWLTLAGIIGSAAGVIARISNRYDGGQQPEVSGILRDSYRFDDFSLMFKLLLLLAAALIVLWSLGSMKREASARLMHQAEYYYLLLPAVAGAMIMTSTADLITLYAGLELLSIATYVLVGLRARGAAAKEATAAAVVQSSKPAEAAFKYVVTGGISSAFILFGMSYLYGLTGSTHVGVIGGLLPEVVDSFRAMLYVAFFFLLAGFGIKIAAAPFHAWAPDVYEGAPTPISAFLAVISKTAAAAALLRLFYNIVYPSGYGDPALSRDLFHGVLAIAACAMLAGTLSALRQRNMKRLLALSGVANAGYLLVPIGLSFYGVHSNNTAELFFYAVVYLFMNIGAFIVLSAVSGSAEADTESGADLKMFEGLYHRAPWTAGAMLMLLLSLAGLPVSGGFFGKLFIMLGAASSHAYWILAVMAVTSVISYYVYFGIIRQMFMRSSGETPVLVPAATGVALWICAACTFVLGVAPGLLLQVFDELFHLIGDLIVIRNG
ncbi:NADH-quinone oxidoreductase subunit N [Paenibacillus xylaniclasticus]|uniref:NADH-quinone oxidoreductase subunit N n=1 Tax=Paenibacillus xylaniclasticus TaxID=588083 RepID=UPI00157FA2A7|nr:MULTISPECIES: NADH-quinone oxidoreductase subunit N [Paenibacillus]GFN32692.1 NADH-quinone oxidoreductase subunit N [Paenibacillus curdlanolyticus]